MRTEEQIIAELKELCVQDGYLNAVAHFCLMTGYIFYSEEIGSNEVSDRYSRKNLIDTEIKTILGFAIKNGINTQEVKPVTVQSYIDQTEELLKELHDSMGLTIRDELFSNSQSEAIPVRTPDEFPNSFFREVIFYCGMSAHNFQLHEFAIEKYKNDNDWLQKTCGVSIQNCVTISKVISDRVLENINSTRSDKTKSSKVLTDGNFLINLFKFNLSEIAKQSELDKNIVQSFMKLFSVDDTERNNLFSELNDYNVIQAKPIIQISSHEYLSLDSTSLYQAIYESPFYWMMRDTGYTNIAVENRGRFAEEFVFNKLSEIFGINNVFKNIDIYSSPSNRLGEIDILVQYSDRIFIVQTKSKGLTLAAQKCNDNTLREDFKKAVQDAYEQGLICAKALLDNKNYMLDSEKNRVEIKHKINDIFIICSTSSHYPAISVQSAHFLKYETSNIIHPPYVLDIFFFDILCEFLNDPLYFMDFLKKRLRYIKSLRATHEHIILSYHLQHNLYFSEKYDRMSLDDDIAQDLDIAMLARRTGAPAKETPEGILTRLKDTPFSKLISQIKHNDDPAIIKFGETLLGLSEDSVLELSGYIENMAKDTKKTGQQHDFTIANDLFGLTIHCNNGSNKEALKLLKNHCEKRKYKQKLHDYYGACIDENLNIRFCITLEYPYVYSDSMDFRSMSLSNLNLINQDKQNTKEKQKTGRNEPCPCGSGKKYKKCCLSK